LTEFAILLRETNSAAASECNAHPSDVFGSIVFLVFACLFSLVLVFGAYQSYCIVWARIWKTKAGLFAQHVLVSVC
jgi:hypothetical protein